MTVTRRELTRAATVEEIERTALDLMRRHGTTAVTFADIAREMRMTAPALYRYFASRDDLLTSLIASTYDDIGTQLRAARESVDRDDVGAQTLALCQAYRAWATTYPERFALLFGLPLAGYVAPEDGPTTEAAHRALDNFKALVVDARRVGTLRPPLVDEATPCLCQEFDSPRHDLTELPTATAASLLNAWGVLQGFVSLEAYGNLGWLDQGTRDDLFVHQVRLLAAATGLPAPKAGWPPPASARAQAPEPAAS